LLINGKSCKIIKMQQVKILLVGITGDLSKRKVLPAIAQFATKNLNKYQTQIIGYSRSKPNMEEIENILAQTTHKYFQDKSQTNVENFDQFKIPAKGHFVSTIENIQGSYEDNTILNNLINSLKKNQHLIIYLAVPPQVFIQFIPKCGHLNTQKFHVVVEKPFGKNSKESTKILSMLDKCNLKKQVRFFDHYLFKDAVREGKKKIQIQGIFKSKKIKRIQVRALEKVGIEKRIGYYDENGALKDMLSHLMSLVNTSLNVWQQAVDFKNSLNLKQIKTKQYDGYQEDLGKKSQTETYFKLNFVAKDTQNQEIIFDLESGKKLSQKLTDINIEFTDNSNLNWQIYPKPQLKILEKNNPKAKFLAITDFVELDHVGLFEYLLSNSHDNFISWENVSINWWLYDKIVHNIPQ